MALDMRRAAGFDVPRYWACGFKGMPALAIERFDRDGQSTPCRVRDWPARYLQ
ncbi:MAG TPA: hypothetical protein EYN15_00870, partial [Chromatiales bacterium]|nr:hypothetical protein [Chromatiales bacterium]